MDKTSKTLSSQVKRKKKWYQEEQQTNKDKASVTRGKTILLTSTGFSTSTVSVAALMHTEVLSFVI